MTYAIDWLTRAAATAGCLGALASGLPSAQAAPWQQAQATPGSGPSSPPPARPPTGSVGSPNAHGPAALSEARIADLRKKLQITSAEEPQFTALAEVMRANAQTMEALLAEREKDTDRTAVASFRWYERLTDAHAESLKKFVPAFAALYTALSDGQRKTADAMFLRFAERPLRHKPR
jgi:hypothetical protein